MPRRTTLPETASVALPKGDDGRLHAPSAARNGAAICDVIAARAPAASRALELASGTGEHAVRIAARLPGLVWQPSEIDAARRRSIDAWAAGAGCTNLRPAIALDACAPGWADRHAGYDLVFASNILHLIGRGEVETLIAEAARALSPGGLLMIYGPFLRDTGFATQADAAFHASLAAQDPEIGYKSVAEIRKTFRKAGLEDGDPVPMPAENLMQIGTKPL